MSRTEKTDKPQKPTLKTISKLCGLAVPTVSRALNDAPDIGDNTKKLVRKIAAEIGYVPNRAGVRLRTGRTFVISLVISTEHDMMNHSARMISSVAAGLRDTQYHLTITPFFPDEDPIKPVKHIVETGSADAVIINQTQPEDPRVAYLLERKFPFATHGRTNWSAQHSYYDFDNEAFGRIAVERLVERNRKFIALVGPPLSQMYAAQMLAGVKAGAEQRNVQAKLVTDVTSDSTADDITLVIRNLLKSEPNIDAIIAGSPSAAMAVATGVESLGLTIGKEVDIFAKEAIPFLNSFRSEMLVVYERIGVAGEFLAKAVVQAIQAPNIPPMQELEIPD